MFLFCSWCVVFKLLLQNLGLLVTSIIQKPCGDSVSLCFFTSLLFMGSQTTPIITGHICGQKLMGGCPRDEPAATVCFSLWASNAPQPNRSVGMQICAAPGIPKEMPICIRANRAERKNDSWSPSVRRGDREVSSLLYAGSVLCFGFTIRRKEARCFLSQALSQRLETAASFQSDEPALNWCVRASVSAAWGARQQQKYRKEKSI